MNGKILKYILLVLITAISADAQWTKQTVDTRASLRGLSVVGEKVIWASGTGGTYLRTIDGGKSWKVGIVPGAENSISATSKRLMKTRLTF